MLLNVGKRSAGLFFLGSFEFYLPLFFSNRPEEKENKEHQNAQKPPANCGELSPEARFLAPEICWWGGLVGIYC